MPVIVKKASQQQIDEFKYGATWEVSDSKEVIYFTEDEYVVVKEGECNLHCDDIGTVHCEAGDIVLLMKGTTVTWDVPKYVKKYYQCPATIL